MTDLTNATYPDVLRLSPHTLQVVCPKHGTHSHLIRSDIKGHQGYWCMICALELLGPSLPTVEQADD